MAQLFPMTVFVLPFRDKSPTGWLLRDLSRPVHSGERALSPISPSCETKIQKQRPFLGGPNLAANRGPGALSAWSHLPGSGLKLRAQRTKRAAEQVETERSCCLFRLVVPSGLPGGAAGLSHCGWHKLRTPRLVSPPGRGTRAGGGEMGAGGKAA